MTVSEDPLPRRERRAAGAARAFERNPTMACLVGAYGLPEGARRLRHPEDTLMADLDPFALVRRPSGAHRSFFFDAPSGRS